MPGGHAEAEVTLPRKPGTSYPDNERLSNWRIYGPGNETVWDGRLERAPRSSGDRVAISPSGVGHQAALEDDKSARMIYRDIDLSHWGQMSAKQRLSLLASWRVSDPTTGPDATSGNPAVVQVINLIGNASPRCEALYDAGAGGEVASVYYDYTLTNHGVADAAWGLALLAHANDDQTGGSDSSADLANIAATGTGTFTPATARRYVSLIWLYNATTASSGGVDRVAAWRKLAAYGNHGLTKRGTEPDAGFYASDVVAHAVAQWAPQLVINDDSIEASSFIIPHLTFPDLTTAGEIVRQATRFGLQDWAVWDGKEFVWHSRGARGRSWRARVGPSGLEETGAQADRLWNSCIVQFSDVDGSTRTVGPVGSGADTETSDLHDDDPENPANKAGITRRDLLVMGVSTTAGATEVGRRFLEAQKLLDTSGRATFTGHILDDRGVLHPYWKLRAGDDVVFVDAADTSARRVVRADHDHDARTCSVDLDSPPEALSALLERLNVVLVPLGIG